MTKGMLIDKDSGDLLLSGGTVAIGDTDAQVAEAVLVAMRGEFKEWPLIGGEAEKILCGREDVLWRGQVRKMLATCGVNVNKLTVEDGQITIE